MTLAPTTASETAVPASPADPAYSRFVQRIRRRYPGQMALLPAGAPVRASMQATLDALLTTGLDMNAALRVLRQLVLERLVVLDCVAPTLPAARGSLPPEGAAAPAARRSRFRGPGWYGVRSAVGSAPVSTVPSKGAFAPWGGPAAGLSPPRLSVRLPQRPWAWRCMS